MAKKLKMYIMIYIFKLTAAADPELPFPVQDTEDKHGE